MKKPPPFTLHVGPAEAGVRLDKLMRKLLPEMPLSGIHRMLRTGGALVDGRRVKGSERLREGSAVSLSLGAEDAERLKKRLAEAPGRADPEGAASLPVLHEDGHVIAFDKPSGIAAHPGSRHRLEDTVLGALYARVGRGGATFTPGLVGRLDRDASGVQLAGTSPEGLRGLSALSREGAVAKTYLALVRGEGLPDEGTVDAMLVDTMRGRARMRALSEGEKDESALAALTEYRVVARGGGAGLVEVRPRTGRRHQIRAHFRSLGSPLAGDVRYGDAKWNRDLAAGAALGRLFLHCTEADFRHPVTGTGTRIRSPLPAELERTLRLLGTKS